MTTVALYCVDEKIYHSAETQHNIKLTTTEYLYKNELLVHIEIEPTLAIGINGMIQTVFKKDRRFENEQFLFKKTYSENNAKSITRSTFEKKLKQFNMNQTTKSIEILEEYQYIGKDGTADIVQVAVTINGGYTTAVIEFRDVKQYENFKQPVWFIKKIG